MKYFVILFAIVFGLATYALWNLPPHKPTHRKEQARVYHLPDGRYCYKHHDPTLGDMWFWLYMAHSHSYYTSNASYPSTQIPGATWVSEKTAPGYVDPAPPAEQVSAIDESPSPETTSEIQVVTDVRGMPETDADGNLIDPDQLAPDQAFDAPADNSDVAAASGGWSGDGGSPSSNETTNSESSPADSSSSADAGGGGGDAGGGDGGN